MAKPTLHFQRFEFKYFLPRAQAKPLLAALRPHMTWDPQAVGSTGSYRVNSLYFDTPDFECFWDKEAGVADRKKLRLRYYGDVLETTTPVFVEIKRKQYELVIKDRINISVAETGHAKMASKFQELRKANPNAEFPNELSWFMKRNILRPKLFISYSRTALLAKRNKEVRVTIDQDIIAREQFSLTHSSRRTRKLYPDGVVLEVKYENVLPSWMHGILQKFELQRLAFSKYGNAVRMLIPAFDDNNYKPI